MESTFIVLNALDFTYIWQSSSVKVVWMRASRLEVSCMHVLVVLDVIVLFRFGPLWISNGSLWRMRPTECSFVVLPFYVESSLLSTAILKWNDRRAITFTFLAICVTAFSVQFIFGVESHVLKFSSRAVQQILWKWYIQNHQSRFWYPNSIILRADFHIPIHHSSTWRWFLKTYGRDAKTKYIKSLCDCSKFPSSHRHFL